MQEETISIVSPSQEDVLVEGNPHEIRWRAQTSSPMLVCLFLVDTHKNSAVQRLVSDMNSEEGSFFWIPTLSGAFKIYIVAQRAPHSRISSYSGCFSVTSPEGNVGLNSLPLPSDILDVVKMYFESTPKLKIVFPLRDMKWVVGAPLSVCWCGGDPSWSLELSLVDVGRCQVDEVLATALPNDTCGGSFSATLAKPGKFQFCITASAKGRRIVSDWDYSETLEIVAPKEKPSSGRLDAETQILLRIISRTAQVKRARIEKRNRSKEPKGPLESEETIAGLIGNQGFKALVRQAKWELVKQACFDELIQKSKEELERKGTTDFEELMKSPDRVGEVMQTASFKALVDNTAQQLVKHDTFKRLAKLKSIDELVRYEEPVKRKTGSEPRKPEGETKHEEEEAPDEESRIARLLDSPGTTEMISGIVGALDRGELTVSKPKPEFFDLLFHIVETRPQLPLRKIEIVLARPRKDFERNIYNMASVLAVVIRQSREQLESLTLQGFDARTLVAVVAGSLLRTHQCLRELNLAHNSLLAKDVMFALRSLPRAQLSLTLTNNRLGREPPRIKHFFSREPNLTLHV